MDPDLRPQRSPMRIAGLARAKKKDIESCYMAVKEASLHRIHTFLATSDVHLEHKLHISRQQRDNNRMMKLYQQRLLTRVAVCGRIRTNTKPHVLADFGWYIPSILYHPYIFPVSWVYLCQQHHQLARGT